MEQVNQALQQIVQTASSMAIKQPDLFDDYAKIQELAKDIATKLGFR